MGWLAENWIWIVLGVVVFVLLGRGRWYGRGALSDRGYGGIAHDGTDHQQATHGPTPSGAQSQSAGPPGVAIDPVTRQDVSTAAALISVYQGRIYYFASAESRQRFEASPAQYAREVFGHPLRSEERPEPTHRHRGGCC